MLYGVIVNIVKLCPEIFLIPHATIPIVVPNGSAFCLIQLIKAIGGHTMKALHKPRQVVGLLKENQEMIMVCNNTQA